MDTRPVPELLPAVEIASGPSPRHSIVWLHGLGADGHDFAPIVPELTRGLAPLRFVFPHAPQRAVTINGGLRMHAWYDIRSFDLGSRADEAGLRESMAQVQALIAREHSAHGIASERVFLAGFSQGGAVALCAALRHAQPLAGVIALSTYLPLADRLAAERSAANACLPVFMGHGSLDPVVPQALGAAARDVLVALGHTVDWHSYPMAHAVLPQEVADLRAWLARRMGD
jgi:phospholipase/carboxylesterase